MVDDHTARSILLERFLFCNTQNLLKVSGTLEVGSTRSGGACNSGYPSLNS
jgi:hypothetical protein